MPVGRNKAFLCLSFASHEGRRWVGVNRHILALSCRGQADKALILYCQAVLLPFFKQFDLYLTLSYSVCCCTILMTIITPYIIAVNPSRFVCPYFYQLLISCNSFLFGFFIILEAGERCGSTPVQFLHCSLPLHLTSARTCGAVIFIVHFKEDKYNMDLSILSTVISSMFVCLSVPC